ncbi:hypothetical protein DS885_13680 [Psychromonas sp. B3M02]|nr:hypothetical protein DS885_13680 [Psychromonas sp. B3M02]
MIQMPSLVPAPNTSLLSAYNKRAFTDCYCTSISKSVTLSQFIEAFYTTRLFKFERWLLAKALCIPSSDEEVSLLAQSNSTELSAWQVKSRSSNEILLAAWQTRSWLCVKPQDGTTPSTTLYFGSAVISTRADGKFGLVFHMFGGFHRLYSKLLLSAAAKKVIANLSQNES